jgi:hypothetical protein
MSFLISISWINKEPRENIYRISRETNGMNNEYTTVEFCTRVNTKW